MENKCFPRGSSTVFPGRSPFCHRIILGYLVLCTIVNKQVPSLDAILWEPCGSVSKTVEVFPPERIYLCFSWKPGRHCLPLSPSSPTQSLRLPNPAKAQFPKAGMLVTTNFHECIKQQPLQSSSHCCFAPEGDILRVYTL